ncbi:MAG: PTS sugar transporter subunit IIB [bacterium]
MRVLAVCGMGLGSSLVLKMNIEKIMEQEGIEGSVEVKDLSSIMGEQADYIFASEEIGAKIEHPAEVISVKNMTDKNEIKEKVLAAYKNL